MSQRTVVIILAIFIAYTGLALLGTLSFLPNLLMTGIWVSMFIVLSIERLRVYSSGNLE